MKFGPGARSHPNETEGKEAKISYHEAKIPVAFHCTHTRGSEAVTRKTRILDVVYNTSNNELVRTRTLVKSAIVQNKTTAALAKKEGEEGEAAAASPAEEAKKSNHLQRKTEKHQKDHKLDAHIEEQFGGGCLLSCISSRPGQCGHADGYILEGKELEFYMKKIHRKKGKGAAA
ncbi:hypothetical protein Q3G72_019753 [Acer saccharum]|nr:hypothetical protein Q3G72_019753 [Acer saccharum]